MIIVLNQGSVEKLREEFNARPVHPTASKEETEYKRILLDSLLKSGRVNTEVFANMFRMVFGVINLKVYDTVCENINATNNGIN